MRKKPYYGIIGNGETCALISPTASIDWLCLPRFDGSIVFSKALTGEAGSFYIELTDEEALIPKKTDQHYVKETNILVTEIDYGTISVSIYDFMPWKGISENIKEKRIIYRMMKIKNKTRKRKKIEISVFTESIGKLEDHKTYHNEHYAFGIHTTRKKIDIKPNGTAEYNITFVYGKTSREILNSIERAKKANIKSEYKKTKEFWRNWLSRGKKFKKFWKRDYEKIFYRSLLLCKLLTYTKTGAIIAAPTASFPATPGGTEMWDYRYCWVRDSYFVGRAFLKTGHSEEVKDLLDFLFSIQNKEGNWNPLYTIEGKKLKKEIKIETKENIVRLGNAARNQLQLDNEGSILHLTYLYYLFTKDRRFIREKWGKIKKAADWISRNYKRPENGIWELREKEHKKRAHWTYGKVMCYVGLESSMRIAEIIGEKTEGKWEIERNALKTEILNGAWSDQRKSFIQTYEDDSQADISVLAIEDYGLISPVSSMMKKTVKLFEEKLLTKGYGVKRFEDAVLPFYLPTLWMALHYIRIGDTERAKKFIDTCIRSSTELYLCAEHFDPLSGTQHGNFPQAFNHSMFIEVLLALEERSYSLKFLNVLNLHFKVLTDFMGKIKPRKELYINNKDL